MFVSSAKSLKKPEHVAQQLSPGLQDFSQPPWHVIVTEQLPSEAVHEQVLKRTARDFES